jgi:hypothetical protein
MQRRVHFFNVSMLDAEGDPVDASAVFAHLGALPAADFADGVASRYLPHDDDELFVEMLHTSAQELAGVFSVKRSRGIPRVERRGAYRPIGLTAGEGLAEARHFIFFPETGVLGIEINGRGPSISAFRDYLIAKGEDVGLFDVRLAFRLSSDQYDKLALTTRISSASISVYRDRLDEVSSLDPALHRGLASIKNSTNALEISVEYKLGDRRRDASLELPWKDDLPAFLQHPARREALHRLRINLRDEEAGRMREIDFLEDRFVGHVEVVRLDEGSVDSDSMFDGIRRSARQLP